MITWFFRIGRALCSQHHTGRPLLTPDEVTTIPGPWQLFFLSGQRPLQAIKLQYYADLKFEGSFDAA